MVFQYKNFRDWLQHKIDREGSVRNLAGKVGFNPQTLWGWMRGYRLPSLEALDRLASGLGVDTSDILLCRDSDLFRGEPIQERLASRVAGLVEEGEIYVVAERCGVSGQFLGQVMRGEKMPRVDRLEDFAGGLGVSVEELVGP